MSIVAPPTSAPDALLKYGGTASSIIIGIGISGRKWKRPLWNCTVTGPLCEGSSACTSRVVLGGAIGTEKEGATSALAPASLERMGWTGLSISIGTTPTSGPVGWTESSMSIVAPPTSARAIGTEKEGATGSCSTSEGRRRMICGKSRRQGNFRGAISIASCSTIVSGWFL